MFKGITKGALGFVGLMIQGTVAQFNVSSHAPTDMPSTTTPPLLSTDAISGIIVAAVAAVLGAGGAALYTRFRTDYKDGRKAKYSKTTDRLVEDGFFHTLSQVIDFDKRPKPSHSNSLARFCGQLGQALMREINEEGIGIGKLDKARLALILESPAQFIKQQLTEIGYFKDDPSQASYINKSDMTIPDETIKRIVKKINLDDLRAAVAHYKEDLEQRRREAGLPDQLQTNHQNSGSDTDCDDADDTRANANGTPNSARFLAKPLRVESKSDEESTDSDASDAVTININAGQ